MSYGFRTPASEIASLRRELERVKALLKSVVTDDGKLRFDTTTSIGTPTGTAPSSGPYVLTSPATVALPLSYVLTGGAGVTVVNATVSTKNRVLIPFGSEPVTGQQIP